MPKVAVLGQRDAVLGFKASGAVAFPADNPAEARERLDPYWKGTMRFCWSPRKLHKFLKRILSLYTVCQNR